MFNFFKKKEIKNKESLIEVNLGENDLLVVETDKYLSKQQRETIIENFDDAFRNKSNRFLVLEGGMKFKVVHRK